MPETLQEKFKALQKIHHQALHELADAVQIIKSYEFLHKLIKSENKQLLAIVARTEELLAAEDFSAFYANAADLNKIIQEYRTQQHGSPDEQAECSLSCECQRLRLNELTQGRYRQLYSRHFSIPTFTRSSR